MKWALYFINMAEHIRNSDCENDEEMRNDLEKYGTAKFKTKRDTRLYACRLSHVYMEHWHFKSQASTF